MQYVEHRAGFTLLRSRSSVKRHCRVAAVEGEVIALGAEVVAEVVAEMLILLFLVLDLSQ